VPLIMKSFLHTRLPVAVTTAVFLLSQIGCASNVTQFKEEVTKQADQMQKGPEQRPRTSDTNFAQALRCMDSLFITYNVRDLSMLIEDLSDQTSKVKAGTKDMFISAVSQMTRRSKAIRLVAFSTSDSTLDMYMKSTAFKSLENMPEYSTRGSISQFDESTVKKQGDAGINLGPFGASAAKQATSSILGLDLNVIRTDDLSLVPGVTARNSVQVLREGFGSDGEVIFQKFGVNFNYTLAKSEGQGQALRTLTELASIELFGKLTKTPYWVCLGTTDKDAAVESEMRDWWENFVADPQTLVVYFQSQMRARGLYRGDIDGRVNPPFIEAIRAYQQVMGLEPNANLNFEFFRRYLAADHATLQAKAKDVVKQVAAADPAPRAPADSPAKPENLNVSIVDSKGAGRTYSRGELYSVEVQPSVDSYLYCYLIDEKKKVNQFFPNPVAQNAAAKGGVKIRFPGSMPFRFVTNSQGLVERVACFAAARDLGTTPLGNTATGADLDSLKNALQKQAGNTIGMGVLDVKPQ
jgi:peptidoglycan hydrolase-like protein with peptidoglycan-binding domain